MKFFLNCFFKWKFYYFFVELRQILNNKYFIFIKKNGPQGAWAQLCSMFCYSNFFGIEMLVLKK
jgi:hypothetical protein